MRIYNANIYTMQEKPVSLGWVEIENGKIKGVHNGTPYSVSDGDIDAGGKMLLPGFIDAHTHIGIIEDGIGFEGDDCNEETDPFTPQMRTIDGVNPFDRCFHEAVKRGITTCITAPGSANACGGEIIAVKTVGKRVDDMLIRPVGIKFALGENPKTVYHDRDETPVTRMATAAIIREGLKKAEIYKRDLERYDENPDDYDEPEYDIKNEALLPLFNHRLKAHFHCHRADDMCTAIRIAKEFKIDLVIIHGTEGHLIPEIIAEENIPVVVGPVICDRCKPEMRNLMISNASMLHRNGVKISICTDHTVIPIQYLPTSAEMAVKGGLPFYEAIKALTVNPAEIIGIADRVGTISVGKDADLQLYAENPLGNMTEPEWVMINGKIVVNNSGE